MSINEIASKINKLTVGTRPFGSLQEIRNRRGHSTRSWKPFASSSKYREYAFHDGGRKELQFNIAHDFLHSIDVFRYGVAFSFSEDRIVKNSKETFQAAVERFNIYYSSDRAYFKGFHLWYYSNKELANYFEDVKEIDDTLFQPGNFVFIGKYFEKDVEEISDDDIEEIIKTFDYLIPLYEYVQFGTSNIEKRIARLCWNDNGWIMPSGSYGKSTNGKTHEAKSSYGYEEWVFDISKLINGYHYGFLQPVHNQRDAYESRTFNAWLYSINGATKKRYWIGEIKNLEVLSEQDAEIIKKEYIRRGWLEEMKDQIIASGVSVDGLFGGKGIDQFNVRYLPANLKLRDNYIEIPLEHPINEQTRYNFTHYKDDFDVKVPDQTNDFAFTLSHNVADSNEDTTLERRIQVREPKLIEIQYLHDAISKALTKKLKEKYGNENVRAEHPAGYGSNRIDIVVKDNDDLIFYEIKSYISLRTSIREAIGQLMEYSLWTSHKKAKKLIVITQPSDDFENAKVYFKHLRDNFNLPLYYQSFDLEKNILSEIF
ncbi:hypothetical protein QTN47_06720 [Danxiaibacter flavus]|uniref:Restriction endonuclease n=1 Tax=Danxiaibacter flavus TaxID=3049108 RepID=A0ABV3ZCH9_9BACT|nr:hypothetical protein QNM32_06720 [Chitinophagaceae bacterium DXS]